MLGVRLPLRTRGGWEDCWGAEWWETCLLLAIPCWPTEVPTIYLLAATETVLALLLVLGRGYLWLRLLHWRCAFLWFYSVYFIVRRWGCRSYRVLRQEAGLFRRRLKRWYSWRCHPGRYHWQVSGAHCPSFYGQGIILIALILLSLIYLYLNYLNSIFIALVILYYVIQNPTINHKQYLR